MSEDSDGVIRSALLSECGRYRWSLCRGNLLGQSHDQKDPDVTSVSSAVEVIRHVCFVMLNPSTADGMQDDPTVRRCIGFARRFGYDYLMVRNLFPFRATDPRDLAKAVQDGIDITGGAEGMAALVAAQHADLVICAWGGSYRNRLRVGMFLDAMRTAGKRLHCLRVSKDGVPAHPLYLPANCELEVFGG